MSLQDIFDSIVCASCGACKGDILCEKSIIDTLRANGLSKDLAPLIEGLKIRSYNHGGSFKYSELYEELRQLKKSKVNYETVNN